MKNFINFIKENKENEIKILELSYYDFINICDMYKAVNFTDKYKQTICDVVKSVRENPELFSNTSKKYHFLVAIKNDMLVGVFYKQLNSNGYGDGYIISKGFGKELINEMRKYGSFITFSNLSNIPSLKSQLKMGGEILCVCDNAPDKNTGNYNTEFTDISLKELMIDEKLYYKDGDDKFYIFDEFGKFKYNDFIKFLLENDRIQVIEPKENIASNIKIYFSFKQL